VFLLGLSVHVVAVIYACTSQKLNPGCKTTPYGCFLSAAGAEEGADTYAGLYTCMVGSLVWSFIHSLLSLIHPGGVQAKPPDPGRILL
jgi:hypothetical protein